jgi:pentapeptide MXKDX repeat protein
MKSVAASLMCACMALAAGGVAAQDAMKKAPMKDDAMAKPMTMQECKDHMAMAKKDATKKDAKKDAACADMMKKEEMMKKK